MSPTTTLRVTSELRDRINALRVGSTSVNELISEALDRYEDDLFWRQYASAASAAVPEDEAADDALWDAAAHDPHT